jgi:hypothetical protein
MQADSPPPATPTTIDELVLADEPERWAALGFTVTGEHCQLGRVWLRFAGLDAGQGIVGWSLRGLASTALDGLPTNDSERPLPAEPPAHENGVLGIDHVVVMTPRLDRSVAALKAAGLDLRRMREQPTPAGAPRQAFFRLGAEILEVVQEPDAVLAKATDPEHPARFWGLALHTGEIERSAARFAPHASPVRPAVQPGREILTLRRSAGLAIPLALMSTRHED